MDYRIRLAAAMLRLIDSGVIEGTYDDALKDLTWQEILQVITGLIEKGFPARGNGRERNSKQDLVALAGLSVAYCGV